ncbi:hypothetical protein V8D89_011367 [Ganoderma adspersum]
MPGDSDLWTLEDLPSSSWRPEKRVLKFVRPRVPADYVCFMPHSWRVKRLSDDLTAYFSRVKQIRIHPEVLSTLESFRPSHTVGSVRALLSPKLEKLSYATHISHEKAIKATAQQATMQLFQKLGRACPLLMQLNLDCSIRSKELRHELANTLSNLPSLSRNHLSTSLFCVRSPRLSNLRVMVIDCIIGDEEWVKLPLRPYLSFSTLGMFNLNTDGMDVAYSLLGSIRSSELQAVCLDVYSPASCSLVEDTFTRLATLHCDLRHLKVVLPCADADPPQEILTPDTLRPLLRLKELIIVDLHGCPIALDDRFLLSCADTCEPVGSVALSTLVPFVHKCPTLRLLGLPLDTAPVALAREMRNILPSMCGGHFQHRLQTLQVGQAAITDVSMVAGFMSGLFPGLLCIDAACSEDEIESGEEEEEEEMRTRNADRWQAVEDEIPDFAAVRLQERAWGKTNCKRFLRRDKTWGAFRLTPQALDAAECRERQRWDAIASTGARAKC